MGPSAPLKRKAPPTHLDRSNARSSKRARINEARTILTQPPDKALGKNGDLDVSAFVKAREFEIQAIDNSVRGSKQMLSTRAFQHVPANMRRRTASHNVKRVPKRLRARAAREVRCASPFSEAESRLK